MDHKCIRTSMNSEIEWCKSQKEVLDDTSTIQTRVHAWLADLFISTKSNPQLHYKFDIE